MKNTLYASLLKAVLSAFIVSSVTFLSYAQTPPATCTAAIGSPANGASHYLSVTWAAVSGATSYELQYSTDGSNWNPLSSGSTATIYNHDAGAIGNMPFYYRVRTVVGAGQSAWKNCAQYPIYTACDAPSLPQLTNATSSSVSVTLIPETPDANPAITTYSIYCQTTGQFVQANGSLGVSEVFQTRSVWGTVAVTGLSASTNYCFYAKAKNMDGDIRVATGGTIVAVEPFTTTANFSTAGPSGPTNKFWSPSTCTTGGLKYSSTGGCTDGYVGFTGSWNNYFGCFLRTPQWNCTGNTSVIINFDLSNSYIASHIKPSPSSSDAIRFYMWVDGGYKQAASVTIGGVEVSSKDGNGTWLKFDAARTCVNVSVTFDLSSSSNLSNILFYLEPNCGYNDSQPFSIGIDNVSLQQSGGTATACLSTTACDAATIQSNPSPQTVCANANASFTVSASGSVASYQWQVSTNGGSSWSNVNNGGVYSNAATATLNITGATTGMNNYQYKCTVTGSCGGNPASSPATLVVNPIVTPSLSLSYPASPICAGALVNFLVTPTNGGANPTYQWKKNGANVGSGADTYSDSNILNGDEVTVTMTSNAPCASPVTVSSASDPFTVLPKVTPSVSISASQTNICPGTMVKFTAIPVNGGTPSYEWIKNGNNAGSDSPFYSDNTLLNNDVITVTMISTAACAQPTIVFSPETIITISTPANAGIISSSGGDTLCSGTPVSLLATGYVGNVQWQSSFTTNNFTDIPAAVSPSYIGAIPQTTYFRIIATSGTCTDTSLVKKIIVTPAPEANFNFNVSGRKVTFNSAGTSGDVTVYDWNFDDGSTHSNEVNPVHNYAIDGTYHVCLSVKNGSNCSFTICKDVTVTSPTSVHDVSNNTGFMVYPNPVSDYLIIKGSLLNATVTVQNILGQTLFSERFSDESSATINMSAFTPGTYLLRISSKEEEFVRRVIKE